MGMPTHFTGSIFQIRNRLFFFKFALTKKSEGNPSLFSLYLGLNSIAPLLTFIDNLDPG